MKTKIIWKNIIIESIKQKKENRYKKVKKQLLMYINQKTQCYHEVKRVNSWKKNFYLLKFLIVYPYSKKFRNNLFFK